MLQTAVDSGSLSSTLTYRIGETNIVSVPEGSFIIVAVPKAYNYSVTQDDGFGNSVIFSCDFNSNFKANGIDVTLNGIAYQLYGEYSTLTSDRKIYIN